MSRFLFTWELGANYGHLTRDLPLARVCRDAGHEVIMAVSDLRSAASFLSKERFTLLQAPLLSLRQHPHPSPPINYAAMLLNEGYADASTLDGVLQGWLGLIKIAKPDAMIYNHAPTALLAARIAELPILLLGTGFELPPLQNPLTSFRPWMDIPVAAHLQVEQLLMQRIEWVWKRLSSHPAPQTLSEIFAGHVTRITTWAELDPLGPRTDAIYVGPVYALPELPQVFWKATDQPRILAYLRPGVPGVEALLSALQSCHAQVLCAVPGLPREWPSRYDQLSFYPHAVHLKHLLPTTRGLITYGASTIGTSLLAGVPVLLIPQVIEQYLTGLSLQTTGAGLMLHQERTSEICSHILNRLLNEPTLVQQAQQFSQRYAHFNQDQVVQDLYKTLQTFA